MNGRPQAVLPLAMSLLLLTALPATVGGTVGLDFGLVRENEPDVRTYTVTDLVASDEAELALIAMGGGGVVAWDLSTGRYSLVQIPSESRVVAVAMAGPRRLAADAMGHLHGLDLDRNTVTWSMVVLEEGELRTVAISEDGELMAFLGLAEGSRMVISVLHLPTMTLMPYWSQDIPQELEGLVPTSAAFVPINCLGPGNITTLAIGTSTGEVYCWRGSGSADRVVSLTSTVVGMHWHGTEGQLVAATRKGVIYTIDVNQGMTTGGLTTSFLDKVNLVCFDMRGDMAVVGGSNGHVEVWDISDGARTQVIRHHVISCGEVAIVNPTHLVTTNVYGGSVLWGPDWDGDGWADETDTFPLDPGEWEDTDGDGVGDNGDRFPTDPKEWMDSDGDRVGDNSDPFPHDASEWADSDGDNVGDNSDFLPTVDNDFAVSLLLVVVTLVAAFPVTRLWYRRRLKRIEDRNEALEWIRDLGLEPLPDIETPEGRSLLDLAFAALKVRGGADPGRLHETIEARDTTVVNLLVALRVQEEIVERGGVGADAAMARTVQLRDQLQEIDAERERLERICSGFWDIQDEVDVILREMWPDLEGIPGRVEPLWEKIHLQENSLDQYRRGSLIRIGEEAKKATRGAFVVASREVGIKGSPRAVGVKVDVPPPPEVVPPEREELDRTPMAVDLQTGRLRTRQAMVLRDFTAELIVSVDNTLAEDVEELAIDFSIAGDRLRHKGPHRVELGTLQTGRSAAATFQMNVAPPPDPSEDSGELTRVLPRVLGKLGGRRLLQELPAKTTTMVTTTLSRPSEWKVQPVEGGEVGRRGVRFPRLPSAFALEALKFPHGLLPMMEGDLPGGGTWRIYSALTEGQEPLMAAMALTVGAESVDLLVEVRAPRGFPARELAEEVIDGLRFSILSDRRLRLRGEDKPLSRERIEELAGLLATTYLGDPKEALAGEGDTLS